MGEIHRALVTDLIEVTETSNTLKQESKLCGEFIRAHDSATTPN
jgi:hypothetical protein